MTCPSIPTNKVRFSVHGSISGQSPKMIFKIKCHETVYIYMKFNFVFFFATAR